MTTVVKSRIIRIGNSQGIRIPKLLLDQAGLVEEVELAIEKDRIVIRSPQNPRQGWEAQFQRMAEMADDHLLDKTLLPYVSQWDEDDWTW